MNSRLNLLVLVIATVALVVSVWAVSRAPDPESGAVVERPAPRDDLEARVGTLEETLRLALDAPDTELRDQLAGLKRRIRELEAARDALRTELEVAPADGADPKPAAAGDLDEVDRSR